MRTIVIASLMILSFSLFAQKEVIIGNLYIDNGNIYYERIDSFDIPIDSIIPIIQNSLVKNNWQIINVENNSISANIDFSNDYKRFNMTSFKSCAQFGTQTRCNIFIQLKEGRYKVLVNSIEFYNSAIGWNSSNMFTNKEGRLSKSKCIKYGFEFINAILNEKTKIVFENEDW